MYNSHGINTIKSINKNMNAQSTFRFNTARCFHKKLHFIVCSIPVPVHFKLE